MQRASQAHGGPKVFFRAYKKCFHFNFFLNQKKNEQSNECAMVTHLEL